MNWVLLLLTAVAISITLTFAGVMIFHDGRTNINRYNEGWLEVIVTGIISIAGCVELRKGLK